MCGPYLQSLGWPWESRCAWEQGPPGPWVLCGCCSSSWESSNWVWLFGSKFDLSFPLLLFKGSLPHKPLAWCKTLLWWQHPPLTLLCWRVKCLGLLLGADERCCIAELCCMLEHYVLEAASENVSVLLLTSIVSSCPNSVVQVAEAVGGCPFLREEERGGWWHLRSTNPILW